MSADGCQCKSMEDNHIVRQQRWREVCAKFYFNQDEASKRVLDYFEACKVDATSISIRQNMDEQMNDLVQLLGLQKCMLPGHDEFFGQTIQMLEIIKNEVRAGYHDHVSKQRFAEFDAQAKESQGTNFEIWSDDTGRQHLSVRVQHDYVRSIENRTKLVERMEIFVEKHLSNVGCHPFLVGLRAALQWNLESSTVVAWKLSDAVFVESGDSEFTHNALALLVLACNFSHCESPDKTESPHRSNSSHVKTRAWYLDPYMSDKEIRQLLRSFPTSKRLHGRPTGSKLLTQMDRVNVHGQRDERLPFFHRWCVVL